MVPGLSKTSVLVLPLGLFDRSRSRTVGPLLSTIFYQQSSDHQSNSRNLPLSLVIWPRSFAVKIALSAGLESAVNLGRRSLNYATEDEHAESARGAIQ